MKRNTLRKLLLAGLLASAGFAAWAWFRPYAWNVDPAARAKVVGCQVRRDFSIYWLDAHLEVAPGQIHDLKKPVRIKTAAGREHEAADVALGSSPDGRITDIWFKFLLESSDLEGPLTLQINDGTLQIKSNSGVPALGVSSIEYFATQNW